MSTSPPFAHNSCGDKSTGSHVRRKTHLQSTASCPPVLSHSATMHWVGASNGETMTKPDEKILQGEKRKLPMMPIRDMVIFPHMMTPFVVGRESSVRALEEALTGDRKIFLATQHDASIDEPSADDIFETGTIGNIVQSVKMPDGNIKVLVEGLERAKAVEVNDADGFFVATVRP